jgi:hypothetical protein
MFDFWLNARKLIESYNYESNPFASRRLVYHKFYVEVLPSAQAKLVH